MLFRSVSSHDICNNVQDVMYAAKLAEHIQQLEDFSGHLKYFKPDGPLSIEKYTRHRMFFDATAKHKEVLFMAGNRVGKEVRISEPVLTPDGWKPIGELKVGDEVCDPNGLRVKVSGVFVWVSMCLCGYLCVFVWVSMCVCVGIYVCVCVWLVS